MNDKIRALQKAHSEKHAEASALLNKTDPTGAEQEKGLALIAEMKGIAADIDREFKRVAGQQELEGMKSSLVEPETAFQHSGTAPGSSTHVLGMEKAGRVVIDSFGTVLEDVGPGTFGSEAKWQLVQSREYKRAFLKMIRCKGSTRSFHGTELKTIQEGFDDQGGAFVPADMIQRIVMRKPTPTRIAGMVTNLTTGRDRIVMPRITYNADDIYPTAFRATWTGEVPASYTAEDVNDQNLTGNLEIPVFTAMLSATVTNDMMEDSAFPIMAWIEDQLRVITDLLKDNMILNGNSKGQPSGILYNLGATDQPTVLQSAVSAKVAGDDLVSGAMAIPEQYDDNISWVFNKTNTGNALRKIKDSNGRYLFGMGTQDSGLSNGRPTNLIGYPFAYSGFMPNLGTQGAAANSDGTVPGTSGNPYAIVGDLLGYYLANRLGITLQVLRETKAKLNSVEILARVRFGGKVAEPWRMRILKVQ